eukprot:SAG31_NODE_1606_length_7761_cov_4.493996_6_plen_85_part_00
MRRYSEAIAEYERALPRLETMAKKMPYLQRLEACIRDNFGNALARNGEFSRAIKHQREALIVLREVLGPDSVETQVNFRNICAD